MTKKKYDFNGGYNKEVLMEVNGLSCVLNMPKAVKVTPKFEISLTLIDEKKTFLTEGSFGSRKQFDSEEAAEVVAEKLREERGYSEVKVVRAPEPVVGLPPYAERKVFKVDDYECPTNWMHGSAMESSFFVPIESEHGMWLNLNRCSQHTHHVAAVISIQGVNPITGQSQVEGKPLSLEQYKIKCPVHDIEFGADRFCEKCGYKWVPQNYLATTGTPSGQFWLDGFLAEDGVVRQYYFTEEEVKGVAHQIVGPEKKVFAIGILFYLSKNPKPLPPKMDLLRSYGGSYFASGQLESLMACNDSGDSDVKLLNYYDSNGPNQVKCSTSKGGQHTNSSKGASNNRSCKMSLASTNSMQKKGLAISDDDIATFKRISLPKDVDVQTDYDPVEESVIMAKTLEIGAGAKINQKIYADPENLDFWQDKPAGWLYINYCTVEQATVILNKGKKDRTKGGEGFLAGLKTGN